MVHIFVVGTVFLTVLVTSLVGATDSVSSDVKTTAAFHDLEELFQVINSDNNSYLRRSGRESDRNLFIDLSPMVCEQSESLFPGGADCTCSMPNIFGDKVNFSCNLLDGGHTVTGVVTLSLVPTLSAAVEATACANSSEQNCVTMEADIKLSDSVTSTCTGATAGGNACNSCSSCDSGGILDIAVDCDNVQEAASMECTDLVSYLNDVA